jgi:hypothetical protein
VDENRKKKKSKDRTRIDKDESERHYKQKIRISKIFVRHGWTATVEKRLPYLLVGLRETFRIRYRADIFAVKGDRKIICEVDGYKGHKSSQAKNLQTLRLRRIREKYGSGIEEYRFTLQRLSKWNDKEIAEEMEL